jgi:hypothetical protein
MKKNLFTHIVDIFLENPNKSNLIHSCILDLFALMVHCDYYNKKFCAHVVSYSMKVTLL